MKKWHEKAEWIYLLVLFVFPLGLFLLWTNKDIPRTNKIIVTGIFLTLLGIGLAVDKGETFNYFYNRFHRMLQ